MKTLHNCFPDCFNKAPYKEAIGIEIETEVMKATDFPEGLLIKETDEEGHPKWLVPASKYWTGVYDGSLRNYGVEFILKEPLSFVDSMIALQEFDKLFKGVPFLPDQPGTSVHVHLNFLNQPLVKIANFIAAYTLTENLLTEFSGKPRRSNLFARPHRVADMQTLIGTRMFDKMVAGDRLAILHSDNEAKYASLNLATLGRLGTLEVRCFRGTTDTGAISDWISILYNLYGYALRMENPRAIFEEYRKHEENLVDLIFPNTKDLLKVPTWKELVWRNEMYFAEYALHIDDWTTLDEKYVTGRPERTKRVSDGAAPVFNDTAVNSFAAMQQSYQTLVNSGILTPAVPTPDSSWAYSEPEDESQF